MKVDIWSDFACPYCYGGKQIFKNAVKELGLEEEIEINYRSYELNPGLDPKGIKRMAKHLAASYKISEEEAIIKLQHSIKFVNEQGLVYDYENMIVTNTRNAHRLVYYAKEFKKAEEMSDRIFKAYFQEGINIGNMDELIDLACQVGLDKEEVKQMLTSNAYMEEIESDIKEAINIEIEVVPTFIFNGSKRVAGVINKEDLVKQLKALDN